MDAALDAAWREVKKVAPQRTIDYSSLRTIMSIRIMAAAKDGVTDPAELTQLALNSIDGLF